MTSKSIGRQRNSKKRRRRHKVRRKIKILRKLTMSNLMRIYLKYWRNCHSRIHFIIHRMIQKLTNKRSSLIKIFTQKWEPLLNRISIIRNQNKMNLLIFPKILKIRKWILVKKRAYLDKLTMSLSNKRKKGKSPLKSSKEVIKSHKFTKNRFLFRLRKWSLSMKTAKDIQQKR